MTKISKPRIERPIALFALAAAFTGGLMAAPQAAPGAPAKPP